MVEFLFPVAMFLFFLENLITSKFVDKNSKISEKTCTLVNFLKLGTVLVLKHRLPGVKVEDYPWSNLDCLGFYGASKVEKSFNIFGYLLSILCKQDIITFLCK